MAMNPDIDEVRILPAHNLKELQDYCLERGDATRLFRDSYHPFELIPIYHLPMEYFDENPELWKIPESLGEESLAKAKEFLSKEGIDPRKPVLLIPYAATSSSLGPDMLKPVADHYVASGYRVLTNVFGDGQQEVEGTEPVSLPADVLLSVIQHGVTVVGVQCGLLDTCEWMHLTDRIIKVFLLETKKDKFYYSNRTKNTDQKIEEKDWGYTIAVSSEQDYLDLSDNIIRLGKKLDASA